MFRNGLAIPQLGFAIARDAAGLPTASRHQMFRHNL